MMSIKKILEVSGLLFCVFLFLCGISLAQTEGQNAGLAQQQSPSTADLESQPNTANYPRRGRRVPRPAPDPSNSDPDPSTAPNNTTPSNTNPSSTNVEPDQNSQVRPGVPASTDTATTAAKRASKSARVERGTAQRSFIPQNGPMIGPPAPAPPTPEQMPPAPARVTYANGLLSVDSMNARLTDVLNAIRAKTGIQFEGIPASPDRVAGKFGPAPADEVLTSLLQGLHLDYVIIGMPENPSVVQRVILTPTSGASTVAANPAGQPAEAANGDDDDSSGDDSSAEPSEQVQQQPQPGQPRIGNGPKTPEQLLEELKRMQQRTAEQNQEQNQQQAPPQTPPSQPPH